MSKPLMRSAIGCAVACGALVGPTLVGAAVASADALGLGGGGGGINVAGVDLLGNPNGNNTTARSSRIEAVSTAPSTRSVVIRAKAPAAEQVAEAAPAISDASFADTPARPATMLGAPLIEAAPKAPPPKESPLPAASPLVSLPLPVGPVIVVPPMPLAVLVPSTSAPVPGSPLGPGASLRPATKIPDSFRVGYAEYLRSASTTDIMAVAVPGVAGIAGFTLIGAFAGYRQARAVQQALLAPVPTRILM